MTELEMQKRLEELERKVDLLLSKFEPRPQPQPMSRAKPPARPAYRTTNQESFEVHSKFKSISLLPILAVICFFMAAIFIVRLAIDSGLLTPTNQWGLLTAFGAALVCSGRLLNSIDRQYRSYLSAAGIVALYISAYSSSLYFDLFPPVGAQGLAAVVSLLCFSLFQYHRSDVFAVLCAIGTYISPVMLGQLGTKDDLIFNGAFFLIWACIFSIISTFLRTRTLPLISSYLGIGIFTFIYQGAVDPYQLRLIIVVLATQFAAFAGGTYYYSIKNNDPLSKEAAISYLPLLLFFYGSIYYFLMILNPDLAPWISLGIAGFLYFLFYLAKSEMKNLNSQNLVHSFLAVVLFHSGYLQIVPNARKPWLLPLIILGTYLSEKRNDLPGVSKIIRFVFGAIALLEFLRICFNLVSDSNLINVVPAAVTIVLGMFYYSRGSRLIKNIEGLYLGLVHLLCVLALYRIVYDMGSLLVSLTWGVYALVILFYGYVKRDPIISKSSLMVLGIASLKALLYDANQAPSSVRILALIVTGAVLYTSGLMFKKISTWKLKTMSE